MLIQNLLLPKIGICTEEEMFFRRQVGNEREIEILSDENCLSFENKGIVSFDTYFNGLSVEKWKKYTNIKNIRLVLFLKGNFEITLFNSEYIGEQVVKKIIDTKTINAEEKTSATFEYNVYEFKGIFSFALKSLQDDSKYHGGYYDAEINAENLKETNVAINICTFKREQYLLRNIKALKKEIIENKEHPMYGHLQIYISDNGQTLPIEELNNDYIHTVKNKNVGGAGGFTRGLIEIMKNQGNYPATHVLMMDDDIIIEPEALLRTYTMLSCRKDEYNDMFVGGAMLRIDMQNIQIESGASWNAGKLISNKSGLNMRLPESCLINEIEEYTEFNAWWYCCVPTSIINNQNLPLPIFIRGDDLEYGLRNMKNLVLMNGICVWHEPFENKYSSFLQYYILRNLLYDNALHFKKFGLAEFLQKLYLMTARELVYYRYKNIDLIFRGVNDYFKGIDFLKEHDGEKLHQEIMAMGYKAQPVENLSNVAFHNQIYNDSLKENEGKLRKLLRFITINGYLLPAKHISGKTVKVVSMAQCRPINFYRQAVILNYDSTTGKGFITERSISKAVAYTFKLFVLSFKAMVKYNSAKNNFKNRINEITNNEFWKKYLEIR